MRSHPSCWNSTLTKLGFKRKTNRKKAEFSRRVRFEPLEQRQMLSGDPVFDLSSTETVVAAEPVFLRANRPEFFLIQPEIPSAPRGEEPIVEVDALGNPIETEIADPEPVFTVKTVHTKQGPQAKIAFSAASTADPPSGLQRLQLELRQDGRVLESYEILIDVAEADFRAQFLQDRIDKVASEVSSTNLPAGFHRQLPPEQREQLKTLREFTGPLTLDESQQLTQLTAAEQAHFVDFIDATLDELAGYSKRQAEYQDLLADETDRETFYSELEKQTQQLKQDRQAVLTDAAREAVKLRETTLRNTTLLLAKELREDLKNENLVIANKAKRLRDELVAISDPYQTVFTGLGVDQEVERKFTTDGAEQAISFVETGRYRFNEQLEIDLGEHQAMVQVTRSSNLRLAAATSVSESPAVEDGSFANYSPTLNGGTSSTLAIEQFNSYGVRQDMLMRFNLGEVVDLNDPTPVSSAALKLTELAGASGAAEVFVWNGLLDAGGGGVTDWDETNLTWNHVQGTLDLDSRLGEFTQLSDWTAGTTTEVDVTAQVQRALLYGDANGDGVFGAAGRDGDIDAFHLAVTNWDAYVAEYGPRANSASDLLARTDGGLGDGVINTQDITDFFRRHGYSQGDYNLDGTVQDNQDSGIDGLDWAVFNANYGQTNARFTQGDGNFDGVVDDDDFDIWFDRKGEDNLTAEEPEIVFWLRPADPSMSLYFAAQEHAMVDGPTLTVTEQPDLALNEFTVDGSNLAVDYAVLGETFTDVKVQLYKTGSPDTLLHEVTGLSGALGSHSVSIAASVLSSLVAGDSIYAKVVGTPSAGTQSNTANDQLDFEFSTATIQTVNSLDDAGIDTLLRDKYTLRELLDANNALGWYDTINFDSTLFDAGPGTIQLGDHDADYLTERIYIEQDVSITGPGQQLLTLDAGGTNRVFNIESGVTATLSDLTITGGGNVTRGGGIYSTGDLTLQSVAVVGNEVLHENTTGTNGGGIYSLNNTLRIYDSTIDDNQARYGGGLAVQLTGTHELIIDGSTISNNIGLGGPTGDSGLGGGLILTTTAGTTGSATITNSTFSGNRSKVGGGLSLRNDDMTAKLVNVTITDNHTTDANDNYIASGYAGGLQAFSPSNTHEVTLHNTILAGNTSTSIYHVEHWGDLGGTVAEPSSYNLLGRQYSTTPTTANSHSQLFDDQNGNQVGDETTPIDPLLSELGDYGGPTHTHIVLPGSPAIDAIELANASATDQRGMGREGLADIGAYEFHAASIVNTPNDLNINKGELSLRQALNEAGQRDGLQEIDFDMNVFGTPQTIQLAAGELKIDNDVVDHDVTINGPGADLLTIRGDGENSVLAIPYSGWGTNTRTVEISGVTIKNGKGTSSRGAGIDALNADLTLDGVRIVENAGHGVYLFEASISLHNSEISENDSEGIYSDAYYLARTLDSEVVNSTVSQNEGRGIHIYAGGPTDFSIINSTITENGSASLGGAGVTLNKGTYSLDTKVHNSIIFDNHGTSDVDGSNFTVASQGNNLIGSDDTGSLTETTATTAQVALAPLDFYGGPTQTHALQSGSLAIDTGSNAHGGDLDQRGSGKLVTKDIGAFESGLFNAISVDGTLTIDDTHSNIDVITLAVTSGGVITLDNQHLVGDRNLVTAIEVIGGSGGDDIDLSQLEISDFPNLNDVRILGGEGEDQVIGSVFSDTILGEGGIDDLQGGAGNDVLNGGGGDDTLTGGLGDDTYAFAGDITLGIDAIYEAIGEGSDTLDFSRLWFGAGVTVDLRNNTGVQQYIDHEGKTASVDWANAPELENVIGTYYEDTLQGDDSSNTLDGYYNNDQIYGHGGGDTLRGGWGADLLIGGAGDDSLYGSSGNDIYQFNELLDMGTDSVYEELGEGNDTLDFSGLDQPIDLDLTNASTPENVAAGRVRLSPIAAQDIENVIGTDHNDQITGNELNNIILGRDGNDDLNGGDGDDVVNGEEGSDTGTGGDGDDESDFGNDDTAAPEIFEISTLYAKGGPKAIRMRLDGNYETGPYTWKLFETDGETPYAGPAYNIGDLLVIGQSGTEGTFQAIVEVTDAAGRSNTQSISFVLSDLDPYDFEVDLEIDVNQTIVLTNPLEQDETYTGTVTNGAVWPQTHPVNPDLQTYYYTPNTDYNGLDSLSFQYEGDQWGLFFSANTTDTGGVTPDGLDYNEAECEYLGGFNIACQHIFELLVGPPVTVELTPVGAEELEEDVYRINPNDDDDNENGLADGSEIYSSVDGEDDLVKLSIDTWFVKENIKDEVLFWFDAAPGLRIWDSASKNKEIIQGKSNNVFTGEDLPKNIWIEMPNTSPLIHSVTIKAQRGETSEVISEDSVSLDGRIAQLTAFRPKAEPGAIPLGTRSVPNEWEEDPKLGPGIRVNTDDDDNNGTVDRLENGPTENENDLIRVNVQSFVDGQNLAFDVGNQLKVWTSADKSGQPLSVDGDGMTATLTEHSYYVEWVPAFHGTSDLKLVDADSDEVQDTLTFHTFKSLVIGFSGETFTANTLGLAMAAPSQPTLSIAKDIYHHGYDIQYFDVWDHDSENPIFSDYSLSGPAVDLAIEAINERFVSHIGIWGWSHGGGATYKLSQTLENLSTGFSQTIMLPFTIDITAYIDAVSYEPYPGPLGLGAIPFTETLNPVPELQRPVLTKQHATWYQTTFEPFRGGPTYIDGNADLQVDLTDDLNPDFIRNHLEILYEILSPEQNPSKHRLRDFVEEKMPTR